MITKVTLESEVDDAKITLEWTEDGDPMVTPNKPCISLESYFDLNDQLRKFLELTDDYKL